MDSSTTKMMDTGEKRLNELGYKQTLNRDLSLFKVIALSLSCITLFTGIVPYFSFALINGGPMGISIGWWVVCFFVTFVVLSLAEICSAFPTTGSLYFWAASLAGPKYSPFTSFFTGWCEFIGLSVVIGGQAFAGTQLLQYIILIGTGGANGGGYFLTKEQFLGIALFEIYFSAAYNLLPVKLIAKVAVFSMGLQVLGGTAFLITLPIVSTSRQSASFVFTEWQDNRYMTGLPNSAYVFICAMLMSQYSLYGFDFAAHMTEETKGSDRNGPSAIIGSFIFTAIFGYCFAISLCFSIPSFDRLFDTTTVTGGGYPVAQIVWDTFNERYGNGAGAYFVLGIIYLSFFLGCCTLTMSAGRVAYALARDNGLPLSFIWRRVSKNKEPTYAVFLCATIGAICLIPTLKNTTAFYAIGGMASVAYQTSYLPPMLLRIFKSEESFPHGPFYLKNYFGRACKLIHVISALWVMYSLVVFMLPYYYPITWKNFNYAPIAIVIAYSLIIIWWVVDARKWFKGPVRELAEENLVHEGE